MELDDLRQSWRQPALIEAPAALDAAALTRLLARTSRNPMAKMRRNARLELGLNICFFVVSLGFIGLAPVLRLRLLGGLLVPVSGVCLYYFYRKLRLLRDMAETEQDLRAYLVRVSAGMRALIRFYYRFTLAMLPVGLLCGFLAGMAEPQANSSAPLSWAKLALGLGLLAAVGGATYWATARGTAWYLQRLYGQHVDRLEASLRELDEGEPGPGQT